MLGVGDFYYELGVQIVEVCLATNHRNGGKSGFIILLVTWFVVDLILFIHVHGQ
jgi:hypothetical protein